MSNFFDLAAYNFKDLQTNLENNLDPNLHDADGFCLMHYACMFNNVNSIQLLIDYNADVNFCNKENMTPLHIACVNFAPNSISLLIENNCKINPLTVNNYNPINLMFERFSECYNINEFSKCTQILLDNKADLKLNEYNQTIIDKLCSMCPDFNSYYEAYQLNNHINKPNKKINNIF